MRILVLGSGGREHAIIKALIQTGSDPQEITCVPGNSGIAQEVSCVNLDPLDGQAISNYALANHISLVIIGPEAPLLAGVSDQLRQDGVAVFGPSLNAAAIEGSKSFAKDIMALAKVPTALSRTCKTLAEVRRAMDNFGAPFVIKADGLAAGKGVLVTSDTSAALAHAEFYLGQSMNILVEEFLEGEEVSLFFLSDGNTVVPLSPAQDFKRAFDDDEGPNTGGMGAYSPLPWLPDNFVALVKNEVAYPTTLQLSKLGKPFVGLLYCGLIVTSKGIKVIEFNARFGDPETQVVLSRLKTPLAPLLYNAAIGALSGVAEPEFSEEVAVAVVLASEGYPTSSAPERAITGLDEAQIDDKIRIYHSATKTKGTELLSSGGRVLSVVALDLDFANARKRAYQALAKISLQGSHYRKDIAKKVSNG